MQAVIAAAGRGARMGPLSESAPTSMLPVAGRPIAGHAASAAVAAGADELVVVVGEDTGGIREYFGETYRDVPVRYAVQRDQRGTLGAVGAAAPLLVDDFAVLDGGDLYDPADVETLFAAGPAVAAVHRDDPETAGVLSTEGDRVVDVAPGSPDSPALVDAGAAVLPAAAADWVDEPAVEYEGDGMTEVLGRAARERDVTAVELERWLDVASPWDLLEANEWKLGGLDRRIDGEVHADASLDGAVVVEDGATIEPGVVVEGPALVRAGATVGPNAYVRGAAMIGRDASVGHGVEIKNTVLMTGARVNHLSYVGDSVLGPAVNVGAGTNVANLRHDEAPVKCTVGDERVSTGRRKFGVVAGPEAKTGINTSLDPGVALSPRATTRPGERVNRDR